MSKSFGLMFVLGACTFAPTTLDVQADAQQPGSTTDGSTSIAQQCHVSDTSVRLCLDFEDSSLDPTVVDRSTLHHDGASQQVTAVPRGAQQAALFATTSQIHVAETPDLDIPDHLTVELWNEVFDLAEQTWLVDNNSQYALAVDHDRMFCYANGAFADTGINLGASAWHHLACTYGDGKLIAFVDGKQAACQKVSGSIDGNANSGGTNIGYNLVGGVDDVHVYARSLTDAEIATLAGATPGPAVQCANSD
ncbi:MAG TPA: LamG-like jellyroll fold domain-containing protein [Kofleriaceae bacterium]|nr:LamG-like jellyroll fold domain-containing protein [Kofleriaceae bacterium]